MCAFPPGARASPSAALLLSVLSTQARHQGEHQDFPPPFDEAEDTFLFGNSDGGLLQRRRNSPFGFSSIVRA